MQNSVPGTTVLYAYSTHYKLQTVLTCHFLRKSDTFEIYARNPRRSVSVIISCIERDRNKQQSQLRPKVLSIAMVEISEIVDSVPPSQERMLDAQEIEAAATKLSRPTARMQLESLAKKLRKESEALKRLEASQQQQQPPQNSLKADDEDEEMPLVEDVTADSRPAAPSVPAKASAPPPQKPAQPPAPLSTAKYIPITTFAFDSGKYNSPTITIYVTLEGVKEIPRENITCDFTKTSLDLVVRDLKGKSYRLFKDNLAHDIDPSASKLLVKADRLVIKLGKVKGKYGYDSWTDLVAKRPRKADKVDDPQSSIMDMMKDMYESGDDNMRKIIGESMEKQRRGELDKGAHGMDDL